MGNGSQSGPKRQPKIPSVIQKAPTKYKKLDYKGYIFFLPKLYLRRKGKDSEFAPQNDNGMTVLVQVSEPQPIDNLTKMPDSRKEIQEFTQNLAISKVEEIVSKKGSQYYILQSKPYVKK